MRIDVLGVGFDNMTLAEAVEAGVRLMEEPGAHYVATPNPEIVEVCRENPEANRAVNGADLVLPDGIGVVKGAERLCTCWGQSPAWRSGRRSGFWSNILGCGSPGPTTAIFRRTAR